MDINYTTQSYCAICDLYFCDTKERAVHVDSSPSHPRCETCNRGFLNKNILRNHYVYSRIHHYCASCRLSFETAAGLRMHIEYAAVHRDDSDDEGDDDIEDLFDGWEDELGMRKYPDEVEEVDDDDDDSWEHFDECDFEDEHDLGDIDPVGLVPEIDDDLVEERDHASFVVQFSCPICEGTPVNICSTSCGHLFCVSCIRQAYKCDGICPICREIGNSTQLRKIYLNM